MCATPLGASSAGRWGYLATPRRFLAISTRGVGHASLTLTRSPSPLRLIVFSRKFCIVPGAAPILPASTTLQIGDKQGGVPTGPPPGGAGESTVTSADTTADASPDASADASADVSPDATTEPYETRARAEKDAGGSSIPAIAGGVAGALVLLASVGLVCFCFGKKGRDRWNEKTAGGAPVGSGRDENWVQVMGLDPPPLAAAEPDNAPAALGLESAGPDGRGGADGSGRGGAGC
jgi:hypothetical protein